MKKLRNKKIIITGGTGFLGSNLSRLLNKNKIKHKCFNSKDYDLRNQKEECFHNINQIMCFI